MGKARAKKRKRGSGHGFTPFKKLAQFIADYHGLRQLSMFRAWWGESGYDNFVESIEGDGDTARVVIPIPFPVPLCVVLIRSPGPTDRVASGWTMWHRPR